MVAYKVGDAVETRVGGFRGVVAEVSREINWDAFRVKFEDGAVRWLRSTDLRECE